MLFNKYRSSDIISFQHLINQMYCEKKLKLSSPKTHMPKKVIQILINHPVVYFKMVD